MSEFINFDKFLINLDTVVGFEYIITEATPECPAQFRIKCVQETNALYYKGPVECFDTEAELSARWQNLTKTLLCED